MTAPTTRERLFEVLRQLKVWKRGGTRAPHKPLLLLLVLGRVWRGEARLASYERDVREPLKQLLRDFGPPRKAFHPELPFWHLRSGTGALWELAGDERLSPVPGRSATSGQLIRHGVMGGLSEPLYRLLRRDPELVRAAADLLLDEHFPDSMHNAIREQIGLPDHATWAVREAAAVSHRPGRDPEFREAVLRAYERRCTFCGFDLRIGDTLFGLEAAHIMWHSHGGPDRVPNGLALCTLHHKAFDRGVIGLEVESDRYRLLVSNELVGQSRMFSEVLDLRGQPLRPPQEGEQRPSAEYVQWHRDEVFRGAPRSWTRQ